MSATKESAQRKTYIERRSIDYIPESERHGRLLSQFTLWFGANLQVTAIVTGLPGGTIEKNRNAQLLSPAALVDGTLGNRVTITRMNPATGAEVSERAVVRTRADGRHQVLRRVGDGQHHHAARGILLLQGRQDLEAAAALQVEVEQREVWLLLRRKPDGGLVVAGLADDVEARFELQQLDHSTAEQRVVVDHEDGVAGRH